MGMKLGLDKTSLQYKLVIDKSEGPMAIPSQEHLERLARLTRDYGRVPDQSAGVCSLWTGTCLTVLGMLTFQWIFAAFHAAGSPSGGLFRFLVRTPPTLPPWLLAVAFCLPFLWAPVIRGLTRLVYPEPFGPVRGEAPPWDLGLGPLVRPIDRWAPLVLLSMVALVSGILLPGFYWALNLAPAALSNKPIIRWTPFLAPLLGLGWAWLAPHLRKAEASEGATLVYAAGFMFTINSPETLFFIFPVYILIIAGLIAYGIWAHVRRKRAMAELALMAEEAADA